MKILAVYNPKSGGSYHRVKLWSEFVENVTLVQDLTEELVSNCDILYIHWNSKTKLTDLSIWREKYNFKIIADIDDVWQNIEETVYTDFLSQHLCLLADQVICSTEYLVPGIMEWNKNIRIIPNLIPFGYGQFTPKIKEARKTRVGIGGSISHYQDYLSLRPLIRKLERETWFQKKCEFVIIGYNNLDKRWQKVAKMFKQVKLFKATSPEEYMSLYNEVDIMLIPLLDTELNRGRSNLKQLECYAKGVIPLKSQLIRNTEFRDFGLEVADYNISCFTDKNHRENFITQMMESFVKDNYNYTITCVDARLQLMSDVLNYPKIESKHNLFSITYKDGQDVEYQNIRNEIKTAHQRSYLFEYMPIINTINNQKIEGDYVGFFSHKFPHKTGFYKKYVEEILDNEDSDVVIFCKQSANYLAFTEQAHPGFIEIFDKVCDRLKLKINNFGPTVYSNFFAAKKDIYFEYLTLLKKAILILHEPEIKELVWKDANYSSGLSPEDLKKYTGLDHYTFHTFILERLMTVWIANKGLTYAVYT